MSAFNFQTYEAFLQNVLKIHQDDRGYRSQLAQAAKVHPSYITRVCNGDAHLTPDQAVCLAEFWGLALLEKEYFLWLVIKDRAGDPALKKMAQDKLAEMKQAQEDLGRNLDAEKVDPLEENEYYLNWIYSALHMLTTLPQGQTLAQLSHRLGVSDAIVKTALGSLNAMGFVEAHGPVWKATKKNIHLSNQSWMASLQHRNWRVAIAERMGRPQGEDLRYTGLHSISKKDLENLRQMVREFLLKTDQLVRPSPEETVCVLSLDLFQI